MKPHAMRFGCVSTGQAQSLAVHRRIAAEAWRIKLSTPRTVMDS